MGLQSQLDEIREEGVFNIGYINTILQDEHFDLNYAINEILPKLIEQGLLDRRREYYYMQHLMLDEYLSDLEEEEFYYLAPYFFNYEKHNKEEE